MSDLKTPKIVIFHRGNHSHFLSALKIMGRLGFDPIVITDSLNAKAIKGVDAVAIQDLDPMISDQWTSFCSVYERLHTNANYHMFSFKRWFYIGALMKLKSLNNVMHLDSDIIVFEDFLAYSESIYASNPFVALNLETQKHDFQMSISPHVSVWSDVALQAMLDFMIESYKKNKPVLLGKFDFHERNNISGGVCDMTIIYLWVASISDDVLLLDLSKFETFKWKFNNNVAKNNGNGVMLLKIKDGSAVFVGQDDHAKMPFVHCQGAAKPVISLYANGVPLILSSLLVNIFLLVKGSLRSLLVSGRRLREFQ